MGLLAICASSMAAAQTDPAPDPVEGVAMAESAISAKLKDPYSAHFTWPYGFRYGTLRVGSYSVTGWIICGLVNAKNSYGGYVGNNSAVAIISHGSVVDAAVESGRYRILGKQCEQLGMPTP
jgi:hypothetical protein